MVTASALNKTGYFSVTVTKRQTKMEARNRPVPKQKQKLSQVKYNI